MSRILLLTLCSMTVLVQALPAVADEYVARVVARAYFYDHPLAVEEMEALVSQNKDLFEPNGPAIRCMRSLGTGLLQAAFNAYDQKALEKAYRSGAPPDIARDVANLVNDSAIKLAWLGQELIWLSEVLPYGAQGNWVPFLTTTFLGRPITHEQALQMLNVYSQLGLGSFLQQNKDTFMQKPLSEDVMFYIALMYGD